MGSKYRMSTSTRSEKEEKHVWKIPPQASTRAGAKKKTTHTSKAGRACSSIHRIRSSPDSRMCLTMRHDMCVS